MKKFFVFVVVLLGLALCPFICGCEDTGRGGYQNQNYSYNDETYVSVIIRNDYSSYVSIFVGSAEFDQLQPGDVRQVTRSLIGNEKLLITVVFFGYNGMPVAQSGQYQFDRDYTEYHMNLLSPGDIRVY